MEQSLRESATGREWDRIFGYAKLALGILGIIFMAWFAEERRGLGLLIGAVAAFVVLAIRHEVVLERIRKTDLVAAFYERGLGRLEDRWAGSGEPGEQYVSESHPYARDLGLFGLGSLFELLCTFRTRAGEKTLAAWLLEPAPPGEIQVRQQAVQELKDRSEFRENLFTAGDQVRPGLRPDLLAAWATQEFPLPSRATPVIVLALATLWIASAVYGIAERSYWPWVLVTLMNGAFNHRLKKRLRGYAQSAEAATQDLDLLYDALRVIEREPFHSARLQDLQRRLQPAGMKASVAIRRLRGIAGYLEQRRNLMVKFVDRSVFYTVLCVLKAESWRRRFGPAIGAWITALSEMEALAALSCYAFEHPADTWPEVGGGEAHFEADGLAHPLLAEEKGVQNDVTLGGALQLIVLSGPNMSGKSTFIRGIGINAVLAQSGAPVRARRLKMSPLRVGASICVLDSLQGGVSRFYAEISRLKLISDLMDGPVPVLFLLDELLSGTNSHDRLEGAESLVRNFVERGGIGLLTTHDLALTRIPESLKGRARNYHFEDRLEGNRLHFDFKLKEGVVQTSNALRLMESIGLLTQ